MNTTIYQLFVNFLSKTGVSKIFHPLMKEHATIFFLHRFEDKAYGAKGLNPDILRHALTYLRKHKFELIGIPELIKNLAEDKPPPNRSIAFTIDDGYLEQLTIAAPIFAEFDCPVTIFLSTGFLDRKLWLWWDQIEYIFNHTKREDFQITLNKRQRKYILSDNKARFFALWNFTEACKQISEEQKKEAIRRLAIINDIELPESPPNDYQPLSWELVRKWEKRGVTFGPHTVTHPILSQTTDHQSHEEIIDSWKRLCEEIQNPIPVFCYPNGRRSDYSEREIKTLQKRNFKGAVTTETGHVGLTNYRKTEGSQFNISRLNLNCEHSKLILHMSGIHRFRQMLNIFS